MSHPDAFNGDDIYWGALRNLSQDEWETLESILWFIGVVPGIAAALNGFLASRGHKNPRASILDLGATVHLRSLI